MKYELHLRCRTCKRQLTMRASEENVEFARRSMRQAEIEHDRMGCADKMVLETTETK